MFHTSNINAKTNPVIRHQMQTIKQLKCDVLQKKQLTCDEGISTIPDLFLESKDKSINWMYGRIQYISCGKRK
jgi:hypothetical protein